MIGYLKNKNYYLIFKQLKTKNKKIMINIQLKIINN